MGKVGRITAWTLGVLGAVLVAVVAAMVWQHLHYLDARRNALHDLQDVFHSNEALHAVTFLEVAPGADLFDAMRALRGATDAFPGAKTVYAGKVAMNALPSSQLSAASGGATTWDAATLVQFDDRATYDAYRGDEAVQAAMARFDTTYTHGMQRSAFANLALVQGFLATRLLQAVTFQPSVLPFEPAPVDPTGSTVAEDRAKLLGERELGRDAVLVFNLAKSGTPEEVAANAQYGAAMMAVMARGGHGPMHIGTAVPLEGNARFDTVLLVYYPGVQYFHDLMGSTFFAGILGDKQLGDTEAAVTVPILHLLQNESEGYREGEEARDEREAREALPVEVDGSDNHC